MKTQCSVPYGQVRTEHSWRWVSVTVGVDRVNEVRQFAGLLAVMIPTFVPGRQKAWA